MSHHFVDPAGSTHNHGAKKYNAGPHGVIPLSLHFHLHAG